MNYTCPCCFTTQSLDKCNYKCTNVRTSPACSRAMANEPFRPEVTGKVALCDVCKQPLTVKVCPNCGFELPLSIGTSKDYPIAIIGAKNAGKSNYVAVLINQLKNAVGYAFNCSLYTTGGEQTTNRYNKDFYAPLYLNKRAVELTDYGEVTPLIYSLLFIKERGLFSKGSRVDRAASLTFFDTAGENLTSEEKVSTFNRYIGHSSGIILLLDPLQLPEVRAELEGKIDLPAETTDVNAILTRSIAVIRKERGITDLTKKIDIPIAVAFTKIDAVDSLMDPSSCLKSDSTHTRNGYFDKNDFSNTDAEMRSLVQKWAGYELEQTLQAQFTTYAFFGLSALGSNPDTNGKIPKFRPFRVADPFLWLLWKNGLIQAK